MKKRDARKEVGRMKEFVELKTIFKFLESLKLSNYFGKVELQYRAGEIVLVRKFDTLKEDDIKALCEGRVVPLGDREVVKDK